jgi:hypothetical protein
VTHVSRQFEDLTLAEGMSSVSVKLNLSNALDIMDFTTPLLLSTYTSLPLVTNVYCVRPNGALAGWGKVDNTTVSWFDNWDNYSDLSIMPVPLADLKNYRTYFKHPNATHRTLSPGPVPIYVTLGRDNIGNVWSPSYYSDSYASFLYLTISHGFRDPNTNEFLGVCALDTDTNPINKYLSKEASAQNSVVAIVERQTGFLIGTSDPSVILYEVSGGTTVRYDGSKASNKRMAAMVKHAQKRYGGTKYTALNDTNIYHSVDGFRFNGEQNGMNIARMYLNNGIDWVVLQSFPMKNYYSGFYNSIIIMCCATVALMIISIGISVLLAHIFMRPIHYLIDQAEAIKLLQLEQVEQNLKDGTSFFSEIESLQLSFKSMANRLKQFKTFLPDHILAVIEDEVGAKKRKQEFNTNKTPEQSVTVNSPSPSEEHHTKTVSDSATEQSRISFDAQRSNSMVNTALNSSLTSGNITVMTIRFPDYIDVLDLYSISDIEETSKELLSEFMDIIRLSKGQAISINSSKATIAWNTYIRQSDHKVRACKAARNCIEALKKLHSLWKESNLPLLEVSISIASGSAYYGNMGSKTTKYFTIIGTPARRSASMSYECAKWSTQIVCDDTVYDSIREEFYLRPLEALSDKHSTKSVLMYELGDMKPLDAWTNDLEDVHPWKLYSQAFSIYQSGLYEDAYELFVQYLQRHVADAAAQTMLALCKLKQKEEITTTLSDNTTTLVEHVEQ